MTVAAREPHAPALTWAEANREYLEAALHRLRLLLARRIRWLRRQWRDDPLQVQSFQGMVVSDARADLLLAAGDPAAEARFHERDEESRRLGRAFAEAELELSALRASREDGLPAAEALAELFDLTDFEREVLLLCLAPELDPAFERLYAYVQDDAARGYPTPHLALSLLADGGRDGAPGERAPRDSFLAAAPLRRFRLLRLEDGSPAAAPGARPLVLDERVAAYLHGVNLPDEAVVEVLRPVPEMPASAAHRELAERLARGFEDGDQGAPWRSVNLIGPPGAGKEAVARELADRLDMLLFRLDAGRLPPPGVERRELLRRLEREAVLLQTAFYLAAGAADPDDKVLEEARREVVDELGALVVVGSRERFRAASEVLAVPVPKPGAADQRALWRQVLAPEDGSLDGVIGALVEQFDLGPRAILGAAAAARDRARLRAEDGGGELSADDLWQACRERSRRPLDELAQRLVPCFGWDDIVLPTDVERQLRELAAQVAQRPRVYGDWGFAARLSRGRGISALFSGASGTGKTMAAEVLAGHLDLDLYRIDLASVVSKYIGETEKNLRQVFDAAEASGAVLFFDEADALFGKRTEVRDSHDRYANVEISYLLQRMEDYRGLAILATNRKSDLDRAFLRRLRFLVDFPFPGAASRRLIWRKVFPPETELDELDHDALATLEIPGGSIRNIALNGAFLAADEGRAVGMGHLMRAARREYAKIEKPVTPGEFGGYYEEVRR